MAKSKKTLTKMGPDARRAVVAKQLGDLQQTLGLTDGLFVRTGAVAMGLMPKDGPRLVEELGRKISLELSQKELSERELVREAQWLFVTELLGRRFPLRAAGLVRLANPHRLGQLNEEEAFALWLGMFRGQTLGLAGQWQLYLDVGDPKLPLPNVIRRTCRPRCKSGENQHYIAACLFHMNASLLSPARYANGLDPQLVIDTADLFSTLEDAAFSSASHQVSPANCETLDALLGLLQAHRQALGMDADDTAHLDGLLTRLQRAGQNGLRFDPDQATVLLGLLVKIRAAGFTDEDTTKIVAWACATTLRGESPADVVVELQPRGNRHVNKVNQNLLRGGNTLTDKYVERIFHEIDSC